MGQSSSSGGFSPFDIYFQYVAEDETVVEVVEPFDPKAIPCYEAISVSSSHSTRVYQVLVLIYFLVCRIRAVRVRVSTVPAVARNRNLGHLYLNLG